MAPACNPAAIEAACTERFKFAAASTDDLQRREQLMRAMANHGLPEEKLVQLLETARKRLACGPECQHRREEDALKRTWDKAKRTKAAAPTEEADAERAYTVFSDGEPAYIDLLEKRYGKQAVAWAEEAVARHVSFVDDLSWMLEEYAVLYTTLPRLKELLLIRQKEEEALVAAIEQREGEARADDRRVVYEVREQEGLGGFHIGAMIALYVVLLVYIVWGDFFALERYKQWFVWVLIGFYAAAPWLVGPLSRGLFSMAAWLSYKWSDRDRRNVALSI
jgi:hypothetical protein